jgi:hypothetical protein
VHLLDLLPQQQQQQQHKLQLAAAAAAVLALLPGLLECEGAVQGPYLLSLLLLLPPQTVAGHYLRCVAAVQAPVSPYLHLLHMLAPHILQMHRTLLLLLLLVTLLCYSGSRSRVGAGVLLMTQAMLLLRQQQQYILAGSSSCSSSASCGDRSHRLQQKMCRSPASMQSAICCY